MSGLIHDGLVPDSAVERIAAHLPLLLPSEAKVARWVLAQPERALDCTAQQLADATGAARATVVRMCRRLGYEGYPQFRIALARGSQAPRRAPAPKASLHADARRLCDGLESALDAVGAEQADRVVGTLIGAGRLLIVANGQSSPAAADLAMRLTSIGRPAEMIPDALAQQIAARQLRAGDVCVVLSASGLNELTLRSTHAAAASAGRLVVITSRQDSPVARLADEAVVVRPSLGSFREELEDTSRLHFALAIEVLVRAVRQAIGTRAARAHAVTLEILGENLAD